MSIRFAAARDGECAHVARVLTRVTVPQAANDSESGIGRDALLRASLRHFAAYGLQAAERAKENAEAAYFAGRSGDYRHWMAICRTLDRRLAASIAARAQR